MVPEKNLNRKKPNKEDFKKETPFLSSSLFYKKKREREGGRVKEKMEGEREREREREG